MLSTIQLTVNGQSLTANSIQVASNLIEEIECSFTFQGSDWNEFDEISAIFQNKQLGTRIEIKLDENNKCNVPQEVLAKKGEVVVNLCAYDTDATTELKSIQMTSYKTKIIIVSQTVNIDGANSNPPSPQYWRNELGAERQARESADLTLQNNINAEILARQSADTLLSNRISTIEGKESGWDNKVGEAPDDGKQYARKNKSWTEVQVTSGVSSVNGKTGTVVLNASDVGAITDAPSDDKEYARKNGNWTEVQGGVTSVNNKTGAVTLNANDVNADPSGSANTVQGNLTTHTNNTNNPHSVTKTQVGLSNVDNVRQYSANNEPPYPVVSVNTKTGTVVLTTNDLVNDSGYITTSVNNLVNYRLSSAQDIIDNEIKDDITSIESKIPLQASSSNQLADKDFVNSSISTETAHYISNNGEPFTSVEQLEAYSGVVTNNDYAIVTGVDSQGNTYYDRYKATIPKPAEASSIWAREYRLNNSSFTAVQWSAINSGITSVLKASYDAHLVNTNNPHNVTKAQVGLGNVGNYKAVSTVANQGLTSSEQSNARDNIGAGTSNFSGNYNDLTNKPIVDNTPTSASTNLITSGGVYSAVSEKYTKPASGIPESDLTSAVQSKLHSVSRHNNGTEQAVYQIDTYPIEAKYDEDGNQINTTYATKAENNAKYTKPASGIPESDLTSAVQSKLHSVSRHNNGTEQAVYQIDTYPIEAKYDEDGNQINTTYATKAENNAKYTKPASGIPSTDLASGVQTTLSNSASHIANRQNPHSVTKAQVGLGNVRNIELFMNTQPTHVPDEEVLAYIVNNTEGVKYTIPQGTYSIPSGGIPSTDMTSAVQTSLGKADTALQSVPATYRTAAAQDVIDGGKEVLSNKVTSISSASTDTQYPTAKCLYDMCGNIETLLAALL